MYSPSVCPASLDSTDLRLTFIAEAEARDAGKQETAAPEYSRADQRLSAPVLGQWDACQILTMRTDGIPFPRYAHQCRAQ